MSKIQLSLYQDTNALEEAQLRSVLLFSRFGKKQEGEEYMLQRLVLSIIIEGDGKYDLACIQNILKRNFSVDMKLKDISRHATHLYNDKLLIVDSSTGNYKAITDEASGREFFSKLNRDTDDLINSIFNRFISLCTGGIPHAPLIKNTIREALSVYYKMSGLTFFRLQKKSDNVKKAIETVFKKLNPTISNRLITAIGETLEQPTPQQKEVLNQWAKAFVITQILQLDPTLSQFKQQQLKEKSFVLDTDVVLHALATHTELSQDYRYCLDYISKLGCRIYIPQEVLAEASGCAQEALDKTYSLTTRQLMELRDALLKSSQSNVFIEDYVCQVLHDEDKQDMNFMTYISNIYRNGHPEVMFRRLATVISTENVNRKLPKVELDEKTEEQLQTAIYELTIDTAKGSGRSDFSNIRFSAFDARLYLTLVQLNKNGIGEQVDLTKGLLPYKFYILTASRKTIKGAKQLNLYSEDIICSPKALLIALKELGELQGKDVSIINLFENPFLVHMADQIWERIEPLINQGVQLYHADIQQLKVMVDEKFDALLVSDNPEEIALRAYQYSRKGFKFSEHIASLGKKNEALTQVVEEKDQIIETQRQLIERLRKQRATERYEERVRNGIKKRSKRK